MRASSTCQSRSVVRDEAAPLAEARGVRCQVHESFSCDLHSLTFDAVLRRLRQRFEHREIAPHSTDLEHAPAEVGGAQQQQVATGRLRGALRLQQLPDARRVDEPDRRRGRPRRCRRCRSRGSSSSCAKRAATARSISPADREDGPTVELGSLEDDVPVTHRGPTVAPGRSRLDLHDDDRDVVTGLGRAVVDDRGEDVVGDGDRRRSSAWRITSMSRSSPNSCWLRWCASVTPSVYRTTMSPGPSSSDCSTNASSTGMPSNGPVQVATSTVPSVRRMIGGG